MAPEADPVVEIRSAVHSNYANMVAMLAADNKVYLGREERYSFTPGQPGSYDNRDGSLCFVSDMPEMYYFLYGEGWSHSHEEMLDRGLTMDQYMEQLRAIPAFAMACNSFVTLAMGGMLLSAIMAPLAKRG